MPTKGDNMARFKGDTIKFIQPIQEYKVVQLPTLPEGIRPQMSGFWNAMQKRKNFRLRLRK